jgi:hypothetical protein
MSSGKALDACLNCVTVVARKGNHREWVCTQVCTSDKFGPKPGEQEGGGAYVLRMQLQQL